MTFDYEYLHEFEAKIAKALAVVCKGLVPNRFIQKKNQKSVSMTFPFIDDVSMILLLGVAFMRVADLCRFPSVLSADIHSAID